MHSVADAIRMVTATMQKELDTGRRSSRLDAHDLVDALLAIADALDPPFAAPIQNRQGGDHASRDE